VSSGGWARNTKALPSERALINRLCELIIAASMMQAVTEGMRLRKKSRPGQCTACLGSKVRPDFAGWRSNRSRTSADGVSPASFFCLRLRQGPLMCDLALCDALAFDQRSVGRYGQRLQQFIYRAFPSPFDFRYGLQS